MICSTTSREKKADSRLLQDRSFPTLSVTSNKTLDPLNIKAIVYIKATSRYTIHVYNSQNHLLVFFSGVHILDDTLWKDKSAFSLNQYMIYIK